MSDENKENEAVANIRKELKSWEKAFASANGGRKPGRDDIKNDAAIGAKYREYNKLIGREQVKARPAETPTKRKQPRPPAPQQTPLKDRSRHDVSATPKKNTATNLEVEEEVQEIIATPAFIRSALGPTPQKDGQVLGIFDMATPSVHASATRTDHDRPAVDATPTKSAPSTSNANARTPQSSGKRFFLDAFAGTPLKRKADDEAETPSTSKRHDATPSFLRRLPSIMEDGDDGFGAAVPFKKPGVVRSLSTIIQGLRQQEEREMDDEWDILNELEAEERGEAPRPAPPRIQVEDSQVGDMPLGPDKAPADSDEEDGAAGPRLDANGKPRKAWKKKGLKRQTRRVIMRPVFNKPGKEKESQVTDDGEVVAETQLQDAPTKRKSVPKDGSDDDVGESDFDDDDDDGGDEPASPARHKQMKQQAKEKETEENAAKKPGRKVNPQAHANFRKLKIKNKNSKANGRGKFGRR